MKEIKAIVYCSNTGFTEAYARMLSEELDLPVFSEKQAHLHLGSGDSVFFLVWVLGSSIKGLEKARKRYDVEGTASVGLVLTDQSVAEIRKRNKIADDAPFFALHGGLAIEKLHGFYKLVFKLGTKALERTSSAPADEKMETYKILTEGASFLDRKNLKPIVSWYSKHFPVKK